MDLPKSLHILRYFEEIYIHAWLIEFGTVWLSQENPEMSKPGSRKANCATVKARYMSVEDILAFICPEKKVYRLSGNMTSFHVKFQRFTFNVSYECKVCWTYKERCKIT